MATWFSGIIPASGAGGPGFDSRSGPVFCLGTNCELLLKPLSFSVHDFSLHDLKSCYMLRDLGQVF